MKSGDEPIRFGDDWDQSRRTRRIAGRTLDLDDIWMTSVFEGGNGMDMGRIGPDHYFVRCEPDPGEHRFSGKSYYFCFAVRNPQPVARKVVIRIAASGWNYFGSQTRHYVVRRGDSYWSWRSGRRGSPRHEEPDTVDIDVQLPRALRRIRSVVVSNFHWNRYTRNCRDWLAALPTDGGAQGDRQKRRTARRSQPWRSAIGPKPPAS